MNQSRRAAAAPVPPLMSLTERHLCIEADAIVPGLSLRIDADIAEAVFPRFECRTQVPDGEVVRNRAADVHLRVADADAVDDEIDRRDGLNELLERLERGQRRQRSHS